MEATRRKSRIDSDVALLAGSAGLILVGLLIRAINHDESQYVAAITLMKGGVPYRDFAYLQTPLQPLLLTPLGLLPAGWVLLAARLVNGLFGLATLALLFCGLRGFASRPARLIACASLLCTDAFLLASSLARNDALPMALSTGAVVLLLRALESRRAGLFGLAGLAFGLAVSAKINAALPAAGAALFLALRWKRAGPGPLAALAGGGLVGLLPIVVMAALAPAGFRFDVLTYNVAAPVQWWTSVGRAGDLGPLHRLLKLAGFAALGAIPAALLATALDRSRRNECLPLEMMIAGGLVASFLPVPFFTQYLVPLLPPLFARFAIALDRLSLTWRRRVLVLVILGSVAGLANSFGVRFSAFEVLRAPSLASEVEALAKGGRVVTLSPERIAGAGVDLDSRFAAGPFLYRTHGKLGRLAETKGRAVPADGLAAAFLAKPPALILTGAERRAWPNFPRGLDGPLAEWALRHGYRPVEIGSFTAFVTPPPVAISR